MKKLKFKNLIVLYILIFILILIIFLNNIIIPKLKLKGNKIIKLNLYEEYIEYGYIVEHYNKDLYYNVKIINEINNSKLGVYDVEYVLNYKNKSIVKTRKIKVVDTIKPEIVLQGEDEIFIKEGQKYSEIGYKAIDNYEGDITNLVTITNNIKEEIGKYEVIYSVSDSSGNTSKKIRIVNVIKNNNGIIYLTFDDGPSEITSKILDLLKEEDIKATFFVLNYSNIYEPIIKRIVEEGHTIALHTYTHNYKLIYSSKENYYNDLNKIKEKVKNTTGITTNIIRFPGGSSNTVSSFNKGIMTLLTKDVIKEGYHYFDWNVDSKDAWDARNSNDVYNNVIYNLSMNRSNIVLLHDKNGNTKTLYALKDIIKTAKNKGYTFNKITNSTPMITHSVKN